MSTNPGTEYEKLVREIYQTLLDATEPRTVKVEHDVKLRGRSGCEHQVDVYWEFGSGRETYKTVIECKHYAKELKVGIVRDFFGVLHDVGDVKGIIVTTRGYQSGAGKFADHYKIGLKLVRPPEDADWEGRLRKLVVEGAGYYPTNVRVWPELDERWLAEMGISEEQVRTGILATGEHAILDASGRRITTLEEIIKAYPLPRERRRDHRILHPLDDAYVEHPELGPLKIRGLWIVYDVAETFARTTVSGDEIAKAILKDVRTGEIDFFDKYGGMR